MSSGIKSASRFNVRAFVGLSPPSPRATIPVWMGRKPGLVNYPKRRHSGAPVTLRRGWLTRDAVFSMNGEPRL